MPLLFDCRLNLNGDKILLAALLDFFNLFLH